MNIKMELSESLLYLDLIKKNGRAPSLTELNMMLYYLENYEQVKTFYKKLQEHEFRPPFVFFNASFIHFIEDYNDCIELKHKILQTQIKRRRKFHILFIHQVMLAKSEDQAKNILKEAKDYGIELGEAWISSYDSMEKIKKDQEAWRENIKQSGQYNDFAKIYENYCDLKLKYFNNISLKQLKENLVGKQMNSTNMKFAQTVVYDRSIYVKEFAKKAANGICQLCDEEAPFLDKQGNPFFEVHHIDYLSKGGSDTIDNVVALCPNCHRKMHHLELKEDVKKIKRKAIENINI